MQRITTSRIFNNTTFRRTGILACSSVLLLFLLGGLVRVTGSGMGCPDWPKCFGLLAPPTCECQLPLNYEQIFLEKRQAKVQKFAKILDRLGLHQQAKRIRTDKNILVPERFNANKAWIEYINRIFGVIAGLLSLSFFLLSLFTPQNRNTRLVAFLGLLMLVINAWLGSVVVATNLLPGIVSLHFMLSFSCVFLFMWAIHLAKPFQHKFEGKKLTLWWNLLFLMIMLEVLLGALARENVEFLLSQDKLTGPEGMMNYKAMDPLFTIHRLFPGVIFVLSLVLVLYLRKISKRQAKAFGLLAILSLVQISFGALNIVFTLPPVSQVLHIVLGSILPVFCFYFILLKRTAQNT